MNSISNKIMIVILLYKTQLDRSKTYQSFIIHSKKLKQQFELLIYNNSPEIHIEPSKSFTLFNADKNNMLTSAYNMALSLANKNGAEWLLLLDQDTELTSEYFELLSKFLSENIDENIAAIVPFLEENNIQLSPHKLILFNNMAIKAQHAGIQNNKTTALNTLTLVRTDFMNRIGGFSSKFPLDMLDYWLYSKIQQNTQKVFVLNTRIKHNLTVSNFEKNMSLSRYDNLLKAEKELMYELGYLPSIFFRFKLALRFLKQFLLFKNKQFALLTLKSFFKK